MPEEQSILEEALPAPGSPLPAKENQQLEAPEPSTLNVKPSTSEFFGYE